MALITTVKDAPAPSSSTPQTPQSSRDRAIAAFNASQATSQHTPITEHPLGNTSNISPENASAVIPKSSQISTSEEAPSPDQSAPETATAPETAPQDPKAAQLAAKYAQLAKQEKLFRKAQADLKAQQTAFKAEQDRLAAERAPKPATFDPSRHIDRDALKSDPFKVLAELGLTYDQLTEQALNAPTSEQVQYQNTIKALEAKISKLEEAQEKVSKTFEENQNQSYTQAVNQIRSEARRLVDSNPDYETIKTTGSIDEVVELIEKTFKEDKDEYGNPVLLTVEEAANLVEQEISERLYRYANKINKVKNRFGQTTPAPAAPTPEKKQDPSEPKQQQRPTLTNSVGTTGKLSARERAVLAGKYGPDWREKVGA